jgi:protein transport protein HofC
MEHVDPKSPDEPADAAQHDIPPDWLETWYSERESAARAGSWRLSHLMWLVAIIAVILWLIITIGPPVVAGGVVLLFAMAIGTGVILARRRSTQQDSLLLILAIAAEGKMPLAPTVAAFADQYKGKYRHRMMNLAAELDRGQSVSDALASVHRIVSRDALLLARAGEATGRLPQALRMAASSRASQLPIWTAIAVRMTYLLTVLLFMQSICGFMLYFIVPKFESIFRDFGIALPEITIWMIETSHFLVRYGYFTVWIPPLEILLLIFLPFSFAGWVNYDIPLIDRLLRRRHTALVLRTLSLSVDAGKPIEPGLSVLADHYPTLWVRRKLIRVDERVQLGEPWISALEGQGLIGGGEADVLASASDVGNLGWALREVAETIERRIALRFQAVIQTLFPLVVVGLGLVVMFMAVSFFMPLVSLIGRLTG